LLEEKEKTLEIDIGEVRFTGDPVYLEKDWENLFSNALTEIGGAIEVVLFEQTDCYGAYPG
jgi:signal transduction histidine kinase